MSKPQRQIIIPEEIRQVFGFIKWDFETDCEKKPDALKFLLDRSDKERQSFANAYVTNLYNSPEIGSLLNKRKLQLMIEFSPTHPKKESEEVSIARVILSSKNPSKTKKKRSSKERNVESRLLTCSFSVIYKGKTYVQTFVYDTNPIAICEVSSRSFTSKSIVKEVLGDWTDD